MPSLDSVWLAALQRSLPFFSLGFCLGKNVKRVGFWTVRLPVCLPGALAPMTSTNVPSKLPLDFVVFKKLSETHIKGIFFCYCMSRWLFTFTRQSPAQRFNCHTFTRFARLVFINVRIANFGISPKTFLTISSIVNKCCCCGSTLLFTWGSLSTVINRSTIKRPHFKHKFRAWSATWLTYSISTISTVFRFSRGVIWEKSLQFFEYL